MTRTFIELPLFRTQWKSLGMTEDDLARLQEQILEDPKVGAVMRGTGGIRKMRFPFEHRGKSGSARVIYIDFEVYEKTNLRHELIHAFLFESGLDGNSIWGNGDNDHPEQVVEWLALQFPKILKVFKECKAL